ncbi:MAG: type II secretion system protein [Bradyrhizobium sp.]|nr:type II secretion system GspH family protein [Pseudomonadota bacterium]MDE2471417.1 type II secretion system protein [Bradyrhizobium sp.]
MIGISRSRLAKHWAHLLKLGGSNVRKNAGFTLVEVIVALAMMSAGLTLLLSLVSNGLARAASARQMAEAGLLIQSLMDRIGPEFAVESSERSGEYPYGYRWHLKVSRYGDGKNGHGSPVTLYAVSAEVEWNDHGVERSYKLSTLRLGRRTVQR